MASVTTSSEQGLIREPYPLKPHMWLWRMRIYPCIANTFISEISSPRDRCDMIFDCEGFTYDVMRSAMHKVCATFYFYWYAYATTVPIFWELSYNTCNKIRWSRISDRAGLMTSRPHLLSLFYLKALCLIKHY